MSFIAQYESGSCAECGMNIHSGEELMYDDDGSLSHVDCLIGESPDQPKLFDFTSARVVRQS